MPLPQKKSISLPPFLQSQNTMPSSEKNWYAVYTKPRNEKKAYELLVESGVDAYLPLVKTLKQWSDRRKWVEEPLFKSYLFVNIDKKEYYKVLNTDGVVRFITFEGKAVPIPPNQIEAIKQFISDGEELPDNIQEFEVGDEVEVIRGAMTGLHGRLISVKKKQKVKIEIEAVAQAIYLSIPKSFLKKV